MKGDDVMFITRSPWLATLLALLVVTPALASEHGVPQVTLPLSRLALIDGNVGEDE